jgi:hypothetical protein
MTDTAPGVHELLFPRQSWGVLIKLGYSGSRNGMTAPQLLAVYRHVARLIAAALASDPRSPRVDAHHGDCTGGDAQFHVIATVLGCRTIAHPPVNPAKRAWCQADEIRAPRDYLPRDWDIASETWEFLAAPRSPEPDRHSGTWITAGYAAQMGHPVWIFLPDGSVRGAWEFGLRQA